MAIRFDRNPIRKAEITPEGFLRAEAIFAKDGILEYRTPDGRVRREFRPPEENKKALESFGLKPFTIEHPRVLLDANNAREHLAGMTDSTVYYDERAGFVRGVITSFDSAAIELIRSGTTPEISAGYQCDLIEKPGIWRGEHYDAIQTNIRVNHICATQKGRAGPEVKILHLDSAQDIAYQITRDDSIQTDTISPKKMAQVTYNGVTYDSIPENFAGIAAAAFRELEQIRSHYDSAYSDLEGYKEQIQDLTSDRDRQMGRADGLEEMIFNADALLSEFGYERHDDGNYYEVEDYRTDGKRKKMIVEEEEEDEDWEEEDDEREDSYDDDDYEDDFEESLWYPEETPGDLLKTWKDADRIIPNFSETNFDSDLTSDGIRRLVFDTLSETGVSYERSRTDSLQNAIAFSRSTSHGSPLQNAQESRALELSNNWQRPLSLSRE